MQIIDGFEGHEQTIIDLFTKTFAASEGPDEGALIGDLVRDLFARTQASEIHAFRAEENGQLVGAVVFTRLTYPGDPRYVVLLSPMAVATAFQRQGIGQALISGALETLRSGGAEIAITYGDPDYYRRSVSNRSRRIRRERRCRSASPMDGSGNP